MAGEAVTKEELDAVVQRFDGLEALIKNSVVPALQAKAQAVAADAKDEVIEQTQGRCLAVRAWLGTLSISKAIGRGIAAVYKFINGAKTLVAFGVAGALAIMAEFDVVDLQPFFELILPTSSKVSPSQAVTLMSVLGIGLRLITSGPAFGRLLSSKSAGGGSDSAVDDPEKR